MSDNPNLRDGRDGAWISSQPHEQAYAATDWLLMKGVSPTPQNVQIVIDTIRRFPAHLKSQGRIPRQSLYDFLSRELIVTRR